MANGEEMTDSASVAAYWANKAAQDAAAQATSAKRVPWTLPLPNGGGNWNPSQALRDSFAALETNPVSGYSQHGIGYGAPLGRFQFSNTAPVPASAPVGWGRYPGTPGGAPTASWVRSPFIPSLPGGGGGGGGTTPPVTVTPPANNGGTVIPSLNKTGWPTVDGTQFGAPISNPAPWAGYQNNWAPPAGYTAPAVNTSGTGRVAQFAQLYKSDPIAAYAAWDMNTPFAQANQGAVRDAVFGGDQSAMNRWINGSQRSNELQALQNNPARWAALYNTWGK